MTIAWMNPAAITDITIHCAATPRGRDHKAAEISAWDIARPDLRQIAYHYVIELDGHVVQTLRHDQRGAHTGGHNTGNLGICYVGGIENDRRLTPADTRTAAQKAAMATLVATLKRRYPNARVRGHRDWPKVAKACPSFDVASWLKEAGL